MIKTFVSYHHENDQLYKEELVGWAKRLNLFEDMSVDTGDIDENLDSQSIRRIIRDDYLRDSEVTVLLCGSETRFRKHVDWELKSTMIDGSKNRRSGIMVINLPTSGSTSWHAVHPGEKEIVYPNYNGGWRSVSDLSEFERIYPNMPRRILENLIIPGVKISITPWDRIYGHPDRLGFLLEQTALSGPENQYDLSRKMRRKNFNPVVDWIDARI